MPKNKEVYRDLFLIVLYPWVIAYTRKTEKYLNKWLPNR